MKKAFAVMLSLTMALSLVACGGGGTNDDSSNSDNEAGGGSVYFLNFKPEANEAWQQLAETYTAETGVEVKVVTAASGDYETTLNAQMGKEGAPTLFSISGLTKLANWEDYCYDLTDTDVVKELTTDDFNLYNEDGELKAMGYCYETFGIITNKALLKEAGYEVSDITNFATLKSVAEDIHARADELGFDAFASAGLDGTSSWRFSGHLTNLPLYYEFRDDNVVAQPATVTGKYLDNYRQIWDLYINNATCDPSELNSKTGDQAEAEFGNGEAVFYQNGSWEYSNLVTDEEKGFKMNADDLTMIPIYCGVDGEENAGLCSGTENFWAVNSQASEEDIQATLDFMAWVVTSDEGTSMLAEQFGPVPFKNAKETSNVFFSAASDYVTNGNYAITWDFGYTPNTESWRAGIVTALQAYTANPSDETFENVKTAYIDGWEIEYNLENA